MEFVFILPYKLQGYRSKGHEIINNKHHLSEIITCDEEKLHHLDYC